MTLSNIKKMKSEKGFTLVELLIVIVVIAILAAIVIVAYNGIQNRAKTQSGKAAASNMQKKIEAYNAATGAYPTATTAATFNTQLNAQTESALGSLVAGAPGTTNYSTTVQVERCSAPANGGFRLGWYDFGSGGVVADAEKIVILTGGTACTAWGTGPI